MNILSIADIGQSQIQEPTYATSKAAVRLFSKSDESSYMTGAELVIDAGRRSSSKFC